MALFFLLLWTIATSVSASSVTAANAEEYTCYLCGGRHTLKIATCPVELDDCHLACLSEHGAVGEASADDGGIDDCYVLKLYNDGSYAILANVSCRASSGCNLVCGDGSWRSTAGGISGADVGFHRCGDQLVAPAAAFSGV